MGQLIDGVWKNIGIETKGGKLQQSASQFRNWLSKEGSKGSFEKGFPAEKDRYHLYVSFACPWAHRVLAFRKLKGLEELLPVSVVSPLMLENGWTFNKDFPGTTGDPLYSSKYLYELYTRADPSYSGRVTVPVLWDKKDQTIVSNESSDIIRMLNTAFDDLGAQEGDYYPQGLEGKIDAINDLVLRNVNSGVYKCGFATTQEAYDENIVPLFETLDKLEAILQNQRFLTGNKLTEADIRLWTTLVRFDIVYATHFKCDRKRISDYPNLSNYLRDIYQTKGIGETVNVPHIRNHYFRSHLHINPTGIVSIGPVVDFEAPHDRTRF